MTERLELVPCAACGHSGRLLRRCRNCGCVVEDARDLRACSVCGRVELGVGLGDAVGHPGLLLCRPHWCDANLDKPFRRRVVHG
jgi:hypothetical protein